MIIVKAKIKLYSGKNKRQTPFADGYRPLFTMQDDDKISGMICLLDRQEFKPGDTGVVDIRFLEGNLSEGVNFYFYESNEALGEGSILEVL